MKITPEQRQQQRSLWMHARLNCYNSIRLVIRLLGATTAKDYNRLNTSAHRGSPIKDTGQQSILGQLASTHGRTIAKVIALQRNIDLSWHEARSKGHLIHG